jgi:hypothetical protein
MIMNRVFILAALLALAGACASATKIGLGEFAVNPQASFLDESSQDVSCASNAACDPQTNGTGPVSALFLNLVTLGVTAGETIQIIAQGGECFIDTVPGCPPESGPYLGGVFDSNSTELASNISANCTVGGAGVDRLTGTVPVPGLGAQPLVTNNPDLDPYFCGPQNPSSPAYVNTTIANDFYIPTAAGITLVVPAGASYLVIGVLDSYYADDDDPSGALGVMINEIEATPPPVPEPATLGSFGMGIAGLLALRRYRSRLRSGSNRGRIIQDELAHNPAKQRSTGKAARAACVPLF